MPFNFYNLLPVLKVLVPAPAPNPKLVGFDRAVLPNNPPEGLARLKVGADVVGPNPNGLFPNKLLAVLVPERNILISNVLA